MVVPFNHLSLLSSHFHIIYSTIYHPTKIVVDGVSQPSNNPKDKQPQRIIQNKFRQRTDQLCGAQTNLKI